MQYSRLWKKNSCEIDVSHLDKLNERMSIDLMDMLDKKQIYEVPPLGKFPQVE